MAVLEHADVHPEFNATASFRKVDEVPFDFQRRRMSVVVAENDTHHLLVCKGAVEEILSVCTHVQHGDAVQPLTPELLSRMQEVTGSLNEEGLRVVAVAAKEMPSDKDNYAVADESGLTLIGYIAFLDPPKETTEPALNALVTRDSSQGIDRRQRACHCENLPRGRLEISGLLLGTDIESMDEKRLGEAVETRTCLPNLPQPIRSVSCVPLGKWPHRRIHG